MPGNLVFSTVVVVLAFISAQGDNTMGRSVEANLFCLFVMTYIITSPAIDVHRMFHHDFFFFFVLSSGGWGKIKL